MLSASDDKTGKKIHGHVVKLAFDLCALVGIALVEMYRAFCDGGNDQQVFDKMIVGGEINGNSWIFEVSSKSELDSVTVIDLLRSIVDLNLLKAGRCVHCLIVVSSLSEYMCVSTALSTMYSKLGSIDLAKLVFEKMPERDCFIWNLMISAYSRKRCPKESLQLLMQMVRSRVRADSSTAIPAISSIAELKSLE